MHHLHAAVNFSFIQFPLRYVDIRDKKMYYLSNLNVFVIYDSMGEFNLLIDQSLI